MANGNQNMAYVTSNLVVPQQMPEPPSFRQWAICTIDDVYEFGNENARQLMLPFKQQIFDAMTDSFPPVRQCAVYGVRVMSRHPNTQSECVEALPVLKALVEFPEAYTSGKLL